MSDLREGLLATVREAAQRERPLYARIGEPAAGSDSWTVKDHVAHLAAWRREASELLRAVLDGDRGRSIEDLDAYNAVILERHRDWPAESVLGAAEESYAELIGVLEGCPVEMLRADRPGTDRPLWVWVAGDTYEHVTDHLVMLAGDDAEAEAAQLWGHDLGSRVLGEPGNVARADYNLGCYYARTGRPQQALPHLRRAFDANAGLRRWADQDADLDGMRELIPT